MLICDWIVRRFGKSSYLVGILFILLSVTFLPGSYVHAVEQSSLAEIYDQAVSNDPTLAGVEHLREFGTPNREIQLWVSPACILLVKSLMVTCVSKSKKWNSH